MRLLVAAGYLVLGGLGVLVAAVHNPFLDLDSWSNLSDFAFVDVEPVLARGLLRSRGCVVAAAVAGVLLVLARAARGRTWRGGSVWGPAVLALAGEAAYAVRLLRHPLEQFTSTEGLALALLRAVALLALGLAVAWRADARRRLLRRMTGLVTELPRRPPAGPWRRRSARRCGTRVSRCATGCGSGGSTSTPTAARAPPERGERAVVRVVRGDQPVALVTYDPGRLGDSSLEQQLGAAARLAIDNERLRAESLAHVRELTDSRARVVAAADLERRTLERDLHDGAQQRLLAVLLELRLAGAPTGAPGWPLDRAVPAAAAALEELRDFAHGVFPAVLEESGLEQALWSLTDSSPVPVTLDVALGDDVRSAAAERAAYLVARAGVDGPRPGFALDARRDGQIVLVASGGGEVDEVHLADRVGAVGGSCAMVGDDWRR